MAMMRLQKILASAGLGSRRACEAFIEAGRVFVDGVPVTRLGAQADPDLQVITLDGEPLKLARKVYYLLNKPVGYLCTNKSDQSGRPLALDLVQRPGVRLFCVGRLDVDSRGAIILTNDGSLSNIVTHPRYNVTKTYRVRVEGRVEPAVLEKLRKGVWLSEGRTGTVDVTIVRTTRRDTLLRLVIKEGKNRIIRRILAKLGLRVTELERTRIGSIALGKLKPGNYRELKQVEIRKLLHSRTK
jgi:23S rRNA pseudouridine2605 synthase